MKTTRTCNGKIARLPRDLREQLNHRLDNGESDQTLLPWLNSLPAVQAMLKDRFAASPINKQNLANWRSGGHQRWLQQQERRELVLELAQNAQELATDASGLEPAGHLSAVLVAELALAANEAQTQLTDPAERCKRLQELLHTLAKVRQQDFLAGRLAIERERRARERRQEEDDDNYRKECEMDPFNINLKVEELGQLRSTPTLQAQLLANRKAEALLRSLKPTPVPSSSPSVKPPPSRTVPSTGQPQSSPVKVNVVARASRPCVSNPSAEDAAKAPAPASRRPKPERRPLARHVPKSQSSGRTGDRRSNTTVPESNLPPISEEKPSPAQPAPAMPSTSSTPSTSQTQSSPVKANTENSISPIPNPVPPVNPVEEPASPLTHEQKLAAAEHRLWLIQNHFIDPDPI